MGYYANSNDSDFFIHAGKHIDLVAAVHHKCDNPYAMNKSNICDVFAEFGFTAETDRHGNVNNLWYEYSKFRTDEVDELFSAIAPFVEQGSYIAFEGEDECLWAYYFDGETYQEYSGHTVFPDMNLSGPKSNHPTIGASYAFCAKDNAECAVRWIRDWFNKNGRDCKAVVGISGGKDSSVVAALCVKALGADRVVGVTMPDLMLTDANYIYDLTDHLGIKLYTIPITTAVADVRNEVECAGIMISKQTSINLPARMRMLTLYAVSQSISGRVANTCNLSENHIGYLTRFGDGAGDFAPLANLTCTEVTQIGVELGLPDHLVHKTPSDGLCGKTDEDCFGFTYEELDQYIRTGKIKNEEVKKKIDDLHKKNLFKQSMEPAYDPRIPIYALK